MTIPSYSRSEWTSLSIQERIRAMNQITTETNDEPSTMENVPQPSSLEETREEESPRTKRSVVDIWRKRDPSVKKLDTYVASSTPTLGARTNNESPVSVPWPDEEEQQVHKPLAAPPPVKVPTPQIYSSHTPPKPPKPSWKSQLKSRSKQQDTEPDLTIIPAKSKDDDDNDEVAAVTVKIKTVVDIWTKQSLSIADSPLTVEGGDDRAFVLPDEEIMTPKRSSVVDIWTKRTGSSLIKSTAKREQKTHVKEESLKPTREETHPIVETKERTEDHTWSIGSRYKPPAGNQNNLKSFVIETEATDTASEASSAVRPWQTQGFRTVVSKESASDPLKTVVAESETTPSVAARWPQLRKVPSKEHTSIVPQVIVEAKDEPAKIVTAAAPDTPSGSGMTRWPQHRKVSTTPVPVVSRLPAVEAGDGIHAPATDESTAPSSSGAWPQLRKASKTLSPAIPPSDPRENFTRHVRPEEPKTPGSVVKRWNPQGEGSLSKLRRVSTKDNPSNEQEVKLVVSGWNTQGNGANTQVRKEVPKSPSRVVSHSSAAPFDEAAESGLEEPNLSSVINRWKPQGSEVSPPRSFPKSVVTLPEAATTPTKLQPNELTIQVVSAAVPVDPDPKAKEHTVDEPKRTNVLDRYKPQQSEMTPLAKLRNTPFKDSPKTAGDAQQERSESVVLSPQTAKPADQSNRTPRISGSPVALLRKVTKPTDWEKAGNHSDDEVNRDLELQESVEPLPEKHPMNPLSLFASRETKNCPEVTSKAASREPKVSRASVLERYKPRVSSTPPLAPSPYGKGPGRNESTKLPDNSPRTAKRADVVGRYACSAKTSSTTNEAPRDVSLATRISQDGAEKVWQAAGDEISTVLTDEKEDQMNLRTAASTGSLPFDEAHMISNQASYVEDHQRLEHSQPSKDQLIPIVPPESFESAEKTKLSFVENPVPQPATASTETTESALFQEQPKSLSGKQEVVPFQSGTSAFQAKTEDGPNGAPTSANTPRSRSIKSRSMKDFLKRHRINASPVMYSSSTSCSFESSDKTDVTTKVDGSLATIDSCLAPTGWLGTSPVSPPAPLQGDYVDATDETPSVWEEPNNGDVLHGTNGDNSKLYTAILDDGLKAAKTDESSHDNFDAVRATRSGNSEDKNHIKLDASLNELSAPMKELAVEAKASNIPRATNGRDYTTVSGPFYEDSATVLTVAGETEEPDESEEDGPGRIISKPEEDGPGRIMSKTDGGSGYERPPESLGESSTPERTKSPEEKQNNAGRRARKKQLMERRRGQQSRGVDDDVSIASAPHTQTNGNQGVRASPDFFALKTNDSDQPTFQEKTLQKEQCQLGPLNRTPRPNLAITADCAPTSNTDPPGTIVADAYQSADASRRSNRYDRARDNHSKMNSLTPVASDAGASDTLSFFSGTSSGCSGVTFGSHASITSPTSALSNRASRALVRKRRTGKLMKVEERSAQDLARRVISQTIKEQPRPGVEEDDDCSNPELAGRLSTNDEPFLFATNDRSPEDGLARRYNTSSRFMDSVQSLMNGINGLGHNTSFGSETTEGSSQVRSVASTSDSEAWMSGQVRKSTSSINRATSDSTATDAETTCQDSDQTGLTQETSDVVTDNFVSESAANMEALKSAYKAVSLHQIAMDLTDEVSTATNLNLKMIASNLTDSVSSASEVLRSSFGGGSPGSKGTRRLQVPKSSSERETTDEEVAIEVEFVEDSDEDDDAEPEDENQSAGDQDPRNEVSEEVTKKDEGIEKCTSSAGEPSEEPGSPDRIRRRAYA